MKVTKNFCHHFNGQKIIENEKKSIHSTLTHHKRRADFGKNKTYFTTFTQRNREICYLKWSNWCCFLLLFANKNWK